MRYSGNVLRTRKLLPAFLAVGSLSLAACGSSGYTRSIEKCKPEDDTTVAATIGSNNENDPSIILQFAQKVNNTYSNPKTYHDEAAKRSFFTLKWGQDNIDGIGEVACRVGNDNPDAKLVFTPSGLEIRQDYIDLHRGDAPTTAIDQEP